MNNLPSGPNSPLLWQSLQWSLAPLKFLDHCQARYGDTFAIKFGDPRLRVILSNPQDIKEIFSHDTEYFYSGNFLVSILLGDNSLIVLYGDRHKKHRQLLMPSFHHQYVKNYAQKINEIAANITNKWEREKAFSLRSEMQKISLEIIIKVVFGIRDPECYEEIKTLILDFVSIFNSPMKATLIYLKFLRQDWGEWTDLVGTI